MATKSNQINQYALFKKIINNPVHADKLVPSTIFMPYYGLFSRDLHIPDLQWKSPLCSLLLWILPLCALLLCSISHYDITMGHDVVMDAALWHNNA